MVNKISNLPEVKVLLELVRLSSTETYNHSISVAYLANEMFKETKYSEYEKEEIIKGALLHDIGKIFVPLNLTQLPGSLSAQEHDIIKIHASISYEIVKPVFSEIVQNICLYHHEKPNGTGYMGKMVLRNIPVEALFVQVADVYDALTSDRSYKRKYDSKEALQIMKNDAYLFSLDDQYVKFLENTIFPTEGR